MSKNTLLVLSNPAASFLRLLEKLPDDVRVVVGQEAEMFREAAPEADAIVNANQPKALLAEVMSWAPKVRWVHSLSAGVENSLVPALVDSDIPLTNSRGVFSHSLGEWVMSAVLFFAKDHRRLLRSQSAGKWEQFDIELIAGKTMGIVSYGSIGQACARMAHPFGMKIFGMRRRPELSHQDPLLDRVFPLEGLKEMISLSDYVVVTSPLTEHTRGLIGAAEVAAMKSTGVIINVGRGPVIQEAPLLEALQARRIRGAALDVFEKEPLPEGHPFFSLDNLLLSPHSADHYPGWIDSSMEYFVENFGRFYRGEPVENLVDKKLGY